MFTSLDEQMKRDDAISTTPRQRMTKWAVIAFVAVVVFGALYSAIQAFSLSFGIDRLPGSELQPRLECDHPG